MVGLYLCIWSWRRMRMIVSHTSLLINLASPRSIPATRREIAPADTVVSLDEEGQGSQAVTPNKAPTPAVKAIAKAPQKVTRVAAVTTDAPPARSAREPN